MSPSVSIGSAADFNAGVRAALDSLSRMADATGKDAELAESLDGVKPIARRLWFAHLTLRRAMRQVEREFVPEPPMQAPGDLATTAPPKLEPAAPPRTRARRSNVGARRTLRRRHPPKKATRRNPWADMTPEQRLARVNAIRKGRGLPPRKA